MICWSCKGIRDIAYTDEAERNYCQECVGALPLPRVAALLDFLQATVPYKVGDRVACRIGAVVDAGVGTVAEISTDLERGATPVVPMFRVVIDEPAYPEAPRESWYSEVCLKAVEAADHV